MEYSSFKYTNPNRKRLYMKHTYSGPKPKTKQSKMAFRRWHGEDTSRSQKWRNTEEPKICPVLKELQDLQTAVNSQKAEPKPLRVYNSRKAVPLSEVRNLQSTEKQKAVPKPKAKNFEWPHDTQTEQHELSVEIKPEEGNINLEGYRVVEINHILQWTLTMQKEHSQKCTCCKIELVGEKKNGLRSTFIFKCFTCEEVFSQSSEQHDKINKAFVRGTLTGGSYYDQANRILSSMDVPVVTEEKFHEIELGLGTLWEEQRRGSAEEIKEAGKREREIIIEEDDIGQNGVRHIMVYVDGGWSKRS